MAKKTNQPILTACRHLGTANDPFQRLEGPTEEHRCYLWMQRDRIDLDHQQGYCLSGHHRNCPWLHISLPCQGGVRRVWRKEITQSLSDKLGKAGVMLARALAAGSKRSGNRLFALAIWLRAKLPQAAVWSWNKLSSVVRAGAVKAAGAGLHLARTALKARLTRRKAGAAPRQAETVPLRAAATAAVEIGNEDFSVLMLLGREANRAGRRREANLCFSRAASVDPASEEAWLWMAASSDDSEVAMACLEKALAINPASGKARTQLAGVALPTPAVKEEVEEAVGVGVGAPKLLQQGISAMDAGNEDRAYQYFASATKADASNEAAWFWRAKTAVDLVEVIACLDRVLEINPRNEKATASLDWALDRQRMDRTRQRFVSMLAPGTMEPRVHPEPEPSPPSLLRFTSFAYFLLGLLWMAPGLYPLLDAPLASFYRRLAILPVLRVPYLSTSALGLSDLSVPEFNLFYLVPLLVGSLSFMVMETSGNGHRLVPFCVAFATGISIAAAGLFMDAGASSMVITAWSALAGTSALLARAAQQRQSRNRSGRSRRTISRAGAEAVAGLSRTPRL